MRTVGRPVASIFTSATSERLSAPIDLGLELALVGQASPVTSSAPSTHVRIGHHVAVGVEDESGADAARAAARRAAAARAGRAGSAPGRAAGRSGGSSSSMSSSDRRCRRAPARPRSMVRMLTTAGPTFSTSSVKSGRPCASPAAGARRAEQAERKREQRGQARRGNATGAARARATWRVRRGATRLAKAKRNGSANREPTAFCARAPRRTFCSVAGGVSPMTVTHQSPWRCVSVEVAPIAASIGRVCRSGRNGSMKTET